MLLETGPVPRTEMLGFPEDVRFFCSLVMAVLYDDECLDLH